MSCICSKLNNTGESVRWLKAAVVRGFDRWELLRSDRDLDNIRGTGYYRSLMKEDGR